MLDTILNNYLIYRVKEETNFDTQNNLWKSGFEAAISMLRGEMLVNAITFMPAEIHNEMIIEREKEYERWSVKRSIQWEVCRCEDDKNIIYISTNIQSIAIQQMQKMREEYCYRALCSAYQKYYVEIYT